MLAQPKRRTWAGEVKDCILRIKEKAQELDLRFKGHERNRKWQNQGKSGFPSITYCSWQGQRNGSSKGFFFIIYFSEYPRDNVKHKTIFQFCKWYKANCIFLQETHSSVEDASFWSNQRGEKFLSSHGTNWSAGIATGLCKGLTDVIDLKVNWEGHWLVVVLKLEDSIFILMKVYGYNNALISFDYYLWCNHRLEGYIQYNTDFIVMGGDFNLTPDEWLDTFKIWYLLNCYNKLLMDFMQTN